jgi:hypothetical protein
VFTAKIHTIRTTFKFCNFPAKKLPGSMAQASIGARLYGVILELVSEPKHVVVEDDGLIKVPLVVMRGSCLL